MDKTALTRLGISLAKLAILAAVSYQVITNKIPVILSMDGQGGSVVAGRALSAIFELGVTIAILLAAVALADWIIQRRRASGSLRMTREEVKQGTASRRAIRSSARSAASGPPARLRAHDGRGGDGRRRGDQPDAPRGRAQVRPQDHARAEDRREGPAPHGRPDPRARAQAQRADHRGQLLARALFPRPVGAEVPAHLYKAVARILVLVARIRAGKAQAISRRRPTTSAGVTLPSWFEGTAR
ncbi:MAG: EscU/YscU/HrcU family type III secretion system export apparatus switch protein [Chloroflexota bacterium]